MNAVATPAGFMKKHALGQSMARCKPYWPFGKDEVNIRVEIASRLERTPRGNTPLIVHRPPVHDALRRHGVEPLFTR